METIHIQSDFNLTIFRFEMQQLKCVFHHFSLPCSIGFQFQTDTGAAAEGLRHPSAPKPASPQNVHSSQLTGFTLRHVFPAAAASVPPESTASPLRLLSPRTHLRSPRRLHRRQVLPPPHLRTSPRLTRPCLLSSVRLF